MTGWRRDEITLSNGLALFVLIDVRGVPRFGVVVVEIAAAKDNGTSTLSTCFAGSFRLVSPLLGNDSDGLDVSRLCGLVFLPAPIFCDIKRFIVKATGTISRCTFGISCQGMHTSNGLLSRNGVTEVYVRQGEGNR